MLHSDSQRLGLWVSGSSLKRVLIVEDLVLSGSVNPYYVQHALELQETESSAVFKCSCARDSSRIISSSIPVTVDTFGAQ